MTTLFKTREGANAFIDDLLDILGIYGYVTVNDVKNLCGESTSSSGDSLGWVSLKDISVRDSYQYFDKRRYAVDLPSYMPLNSKDGGYGGHTVEYSRYWRNGISTDYKTALNNRYGLHHSLPIKKVIFNDPATIVFWNDGTKTIVKAHNEKFDPEKGMAMAIAKYYLGSMYVKSFKTFISEDCEERPDILEDVLGYLGECLDYNETRDYDPVERAYTLLRDYIYGKNKEAK